jgi:phosphoglycolate phosphatase-like HAD superfamily hydrolase
VKLAVFDIDGTLTLGDGLGTRCFFGSFEEVFGRTCDRRLESYRESTDSGIAREAVRSALGREPEPSELEAFKRRYLERLELEIGCRDHAYRPLPGAREVLGIVAASEGWRVAIATGNWKRAAGLKLACARIEAPRAGGFSEDGPSRRDVLAAAVAAGEREAGREFELVVYVGDQPWDLRAAADLGVAFVGVGARRRLLEQYGVPGLDDFADPARVLAALRQAAPPAAPKFGV